MKEKIKEQIEILDVCIEDLEVVKAFMTGEFYDVTDYRDKSFNELIVIYLSTPHQIKQVLSDALETIGDLRQTQIHELLNK